MIGDVEGSRVQTRERGVKLDNPLTIRQLVNRPLISQEYSDENWKLVAECNYNPRLPLLVSLECLYYEKYGVTITLGLMVYKTSASHPLAQVSGVQVSTIYEIIYKQLPACSNFNYVLAFLVRPA